MEGIEPNPGPALPAARPPPPSLHCISFNCNGLSAKGRLEELERGIADQQPDVVLLQELKEAQVTGVHIPGYRTFLRKRTVKRGKGALQTGGGIATLVRSEIKARVVHSSREYVERSVREYIKVCGAHTHTYSVYS